MTQNSSFTPKNEEQKDFESVIESAKVESSLLSTEISNLKTTVESFVERHSKERSKNEQE